MERVSLLSAGGAVPRHHGVRGGLPVQGVPACGQLRGPSGDSTGGDVDCYVITLHYITLHQVTPTLLKLDTYTMDQAKDPLFRGEFEVVKELLAKLKNGAAAKNVCDKVLSG